MLRTFALLTLLAIPAVPLAEDKPDGKSAGSGKRFELNFEDDTLEGDLKRPDGEYVEARKKVDHSNLIRIREEWRDKVMQASGEL